LQRVSDLAAHLFKAFVNFFGGFFCGITGFVHPGDEATGIRQKLNNNRT